MRRQRPGKLKREAKKIFEQKFNSSAQDSLQDSLENKKESSESETPAGDKPKLPCKNSLPT